MAAVLLCLASCSVGCGEEAPPKIEPTYENVAAVVARSCTFSNVCHGDGGQANLDFEASSADITAVLNGVPACQYGPMPRVDPGNPDNSWIMVKLDGMYDAEANIQFTPDPGFVPDDTTPECATFGTLMPSNSVPTPLPLEEVELIRSWIRAGAPGPSGS